MSQCTLLEPCIGRVRLGAILSYVLKLQLAVRVRNKVAHFEVKLDKPPFAGVSDLNGVSKRQLTNLTKICLSEVPQVSRSSLQTAATDASEMVAGLWSNPLVNGETLASFSGNEKLADATKSK